MKNYTGKILSFLFLFNLLFIQGVDILEARQLPVVDQINGTQKHYSALENLCGTVSILCETDEADNDQKLMARGEDVSANPAKFLCHFIISSFPDPSLEPVLAHSTTWVFSLQNISLLQRHCCFLI